MPDISQCRAFYRYCYYMKSLIVISEELLTEYLMAVLGARTNNSSMVTSSLKSAVAKDPSLAKKAASDLEFAKYFTNADFMSIIQ